MILFFACLLVFQTACGMFTESKYLAQYESLERAIGRRDANKAIRILDDHNGQAMIHEANFQGKAVIAQAVESCCNIRLIEKLLQMGADAHYQGHQGISPFSLAIIRGRAKEVVEALEASSDRNLMVREVLLTLTRAISSSGIQQVGTILNSPVGQAIINEANAQKMPIVAQAVANYLPITLIEQLLQMGADVNAKFEGETALHRAIMFGDKDLIWMLIVTGDADLTVKNDDGKTPDFDQPMGRFSMQDVDYVSQDRDFASGPKLRREWDEKFESHTHIPEIQHSLDWTICGARAWRKIKSMPSTIKKFLFFCGCCNNKKRA